MKFTSEITVTLIDRMGDDARLAGAAWVSTSAEEALLRAKNKPEDVPGVINYLMKQKHGTPFEAACLQFYVHAPIFVWREWHRHRIGFSYNEESARYKQLDPVFYIPPPDRRMMKVENWKAGRPKFLTIQEHFEGHGLTGTLLEGAVRSHYNAFVENMQHSCEIAYKTYEQNLKWGFDPGLARDCLPVGIYSSCWVTCNPRSLMNFLALRTFDPDAKHVSYPLYEIEVAARKVEMLFAGYFPITFAAFHDHGRVAP